MTAFRRPLAADRRVLMGPGHTRATGAGDEADSEGSLPADLGGAFWRSGPDWFDRVGVVQRHSAFHGAGVST